MLYDTHFHAKYSIDGKDHIENYIKRAQELQIGLAVTEHMDLINPRAGTYNQPSVFDCTAMLKEYSQYASENFAIGIELGMNSSVLEQNKKIAGDHNWDYVLASMHTFNDIGCGDIDYSSTTTTAVYRQYFNNFAETLQKHAFVDAIAHIDYISRYNPLDDRYITLKNGGTGLVEVLRLIAMRNIALEINTEQLADPLSGNSYREILREFRKQGGRYFTVGSDAHRVSRLGYMLQPAYEMGTDAGLTPVYFKKREMRIL